MGPAALRAAFDFILLHDKDLAAGTSDLHLLHQHFPFIGKN
jgi:hypothetical protein